MARLATDRVARGSQFLLPGEDAIWVAEELVRRWGLPRWQFTLSASQANTEVMRLARVATGRQIVDRERAAKAVLELINLKDTAQYGLVPITKRELTTTLRRARILLDFAREVLRR